MKPRRGLPGPSDPAEDPGSDETQLEMSAIRRGLWLGDDQEPHVPRRAARAADEPDVASIDLQPSQPAPGAQRQPRKQPEQRTGKRVVPTAPDAQPPERGFLPDRRWAKAVAGGALISLALAFGIGAIPAQPAPLPAIVPLVTAISRTCPVADVEPGKLLALSSRGSILLRPVGQADATSHPGELALPGQTIPTVITPSESQASVTGGNLVQTGAQTWWGACRSSAADQYVQVPGGAGAKLAIVNPDPEPALIDVTLSGPNGEITGDGLRGITIAADSQRVIDLAPLAGSVDAVGARVRSSAGRVMVAAQVSRPQGGDFATATFQARELVIAAIPEGAGKVQLLLTNPGTTRNVVKIEAAGTAGRYELPGFEAYALDAQRTVAVDLTDAIDGVPVALMISGRDEFAASAVVTVGDDFGIEAAHVDDESITWQDLVGVVPDAGTLQLANPGADEALVTIDWGPGQAPANRTIAPGSVASIEVPAGAGQVHLIATAPIAAAIMLRPAGHPGFAIAVLNPAARSQPSMPLEVEAGLGR